MFSKHVWYDRRHQAEVFLTDDGAISGTIVAYEGAVSVINPRPEILTALYQEAKLKRILSLKGILLTDNTIDYTRGLCALVSYSRGLRRRTPLTIVTRHDTGISPDVLNRCCSQLLGDALFEVRMVPLGYGQSHQLGTGTISFVKPEGSAVNPVLVMKTSRCALHYLDETHVGAPAEWSTVSSERPNVVIRAAELPRPMREIRQTMTVPA